MTPLNYIAESQSWDFLDSLTAGKECSLSHAMQYSKVKMDGCVKISYIIV